MVNETDTETKKGSKQSLIFIYLFIFSPQRFWYRSGPSRPRGHFHGLALTWEAAGQGGMSPAETAWSTRTATSAV